ncbi:MAG: acetylhydrolase, partial [Saprospiraceae bacterium]|nr:acetylhydrolase [Saprospiraceae bacterium]
MIKVRQPLAGITIMGILPRRNYESRIRILNLQIAQIASETEIGYGDIGHIFLEGLRINESLFSDGLHPNAEGYRRMKAALEGYIP